MSLALLFVLLTFASARIVRLVAVDTITEPVRTWLIRHAGNRLRQSVATGASCVWCVGWWVSAALVGAVWAAGYDLPLPLLWPWAIAGGQMVVNGVDLRLDTH